MLQTPIKHFNATITGTTVAHLGDNHLRTIKIMMPNIETLEAARVILDPIYNFEINLRMKNVNLRRTRDLLLPKLVSGELDINKLEILTE